MDNKIVMISIAAVIGIIVLGSVLMPIMNDATATTDTFTNDGLIYLKEIDDDFETTIVWDHTDPLRLTIDGKTIDMPTNSPYQITAMFSDDWMLRVNPGVSGGADIMEVNTAGTGIYVGASVAQSTDLTVTVSNGTATMSNGTTTKTKLIDGGLAITAGDDATYVLKASTEKAYVLGDSVVYGAGRTNNAIGPSTYLNAIFEGNIDDGMTAVYSPNTWTLGDITISYDSVTDHKQLYQISSFQTLASYNGASGTITYSQFFVPAEVTAERSVHFTAGQNAIFAAIPVMIILAVLLGVVALVIRSRMD